MTRSQRKEITFYKKLGELLTKYGVTIDGTNEGKVDIDFTQQFNSLSSMETWYITPLDCENAVKKLEKQYEARL